MQDLDIGLISFLLLGAVAAFAAIYYSFGMLRKLLGQWTRATNGPVRKTVSQMHLSMDTLPPNGLKGACGWTSCWR
jgi:hypothetical protein